MMRGRGSAPSMAVTTGREGPTGILAVPVIGGFQPVRSRWTWQLRLPELWLSEQERLRLRETISGLKKKV